MDNKLLAAAAKLGVRGATAGCAARTMLVGARRKRDENRKEPRWNRVVAWLETACLENPEHYISRAIDLIDQIED